MKNIRKLLGSVGPQKYLSCPRYTQVSDLTYIFMHNDDFTNSLVSFVVYAAFIDTRHTRCSWLGVPGNSISAVCAACSGLSVLVSRAPIASLLFQQLPSVCLFLGIEIVKCAKSSFGVFAKCSWYLQMTVDFVFNKVCSDLYQESSSPRGTAQLFPVWIVGDPGDKRSDCANIKHVKEQDKWSYSCLERDREQSG